MYQTFRNMTVNMARMQDAIGLITTTRETDSTANTAATTPSLSPSAGIHRQSACRVRSRHSDSTKPCALQSRDDPVIQSVIRMSGDVLTSVQDTIGQIVKPPAPRGAFVTVNLAMMHMPAVVDAIGFALEVAEFVEQKNGSAVGVMTAMTGNRAGLLWMGFSESLDQLANDAQALETDPDYLAFFARSENLFVPGTLEQSIWQILP